jgi:WD40 repeat protein
MWNIVDPTASVLEFEHMRTIKDHSSSVWTCAVNPSSKYFLTGSSDGTIKVNNSAGVV